MPQIRTENPKNQVFCADFLDRNRFDTYIIFSLNL